jgi:curved DNA-binding protein CbpA
MSSSKPDYYKILNLQQSATNEEIKKNYHKLAKKWHPDKNGNLEALERFKLIKNAYEVLNNEASRREYDNLKFQEPQSMKKEQTPKKETDERIFNIFTNSWQFKTQSNQFIYENGSSFNAGTNFSSEQIKFGNGCKFGPNCNFSSQSKFGNGCHFGENCNFQSNCEFGSGCSFGENQNFGNMCKFSSGCSFGHYCNFGNSSVFGSGSCILNGHNIGNNCKFGAGCRVFND